jgi:hypothetical protein
VRGILQGVRLGLLRTHPVLASLVPPVHFHDLHVVCIPDNNSHILYRHIAQRLDAAHRGLGYCDQVGPKTLSVKLGGASDPDSGIDSYSVCFGSSAYSSNLVPCTDIKLSGSFVTSSLPLSLPLQPFHVTVVAFNGAHGQTSFTTRQLRWSAAAPQVSDLRTFRPRDTAWLTTGAWSGDPREIRARFFVSEACPDVSIVAANYSIGTSPGAANIQGWQPVGASATLSGKSSSTPIIVRASSLDLAHGAAYYTNVETLNSAGLRQVFSSAPLRTDFTPPVATAPVRKVLHHRTRIHSCCYSLSSS